MSDKKETAVIELPPSPVETSVEGMISALASLQASSGWQIVKKVVEDNISYLETCILDRRDPLTNEELTDKEVETLRHKRALNKDVLEMPAKYMNKLLEKREVVKNYDPYQE